MKDNDSPFKRSFVRFEFPKWTEDSFHYDEEGTLPGWVTDEMKERAVSVLLRVHPAYTEYLKVSDAAYAEYRKVSDPAYTEYLKVRDAAYAEYLKVRDAAYAEYCKVSDAAYAEYLKVRDAAYAEYLKVSDAAYENMISAMSTITGYTPQK
jgi:hypothetical protein